MSDLRLKIRNKIYTSGNHIIDTRNNDHAIVVFLGKMSSDCLKPYVDNFMRDTLKSQISTNKFSYVVMDGENLNGLQEQIAVAIRKTEFNATVTNKLYISFVCLMDDDIYRSQPKINIEEIEKLKTSALDGYAVEVYYDFYGIFTSDAVYENRTNARKTIVDLLATENGGVNVRKRIFHQACPGNNYYQAAKSVSFMILANLIGKLDLHMVMDCDAEGDDYTWNTFALFEKNLASLVIYEVINKLLENQVSGVEMVSIENITQAINDELDSLETKMRKVASSADINYMPVRVKRMERALTFAEKAKNMFSKDKVSAVEFRKEDEDVSVRELVEQQRAVLDRYLDETMDTTYMDQLIMKLIRMCTVMSSVGAMSQDALILKSLELCASELAGQAAKYHAPQTISDSADYYIPQYNSLIRQTKARALEKVIEYYKANIGAYIEKVQEHWNAMNIEVRTLINEFAMFQDYFDGISDLIQDKTISLMSSYEDILDKIDIESVMRAIVSNTEIYSNILASYYDNVKAAGDIARKFGNRNIVPDYNNMSYCLFSNKDVNCPQQLKLVVDDYWFREHEIAILFTAKNNRTDCNNLPFGE